MQQPSEGALAGLRVIDLTRVLGGPFCTQILADHGADVIKIEPPQGDETRGWGPPFVDGVASYFIGVNRNKRSVVLDLSKDEGRNALLGLLEGADVLVENFKTGTMERWGLGYDAVLAGRFPALVHCRISGFGADGPLGGLPGYDAVVQAMTGLMSINGEKGGGPLRMGSPLVDLATGYNATIGILLALQERVRSGRGQFVDITLYDSGIAMLHPHSANYFLTGKAPGRSGNAHPNITPYDSFRTATVPLFLAVGNDGQFRKLCRTLGQEAMADDPRFADNASRSANRDALKVALEALMDSRDGNALAADLNAAGVPCGPVLDVGEVVAHPHAQHRGMVVEMEGYRGTGAPVKLGRTPATYRRRPPRLGEHDDEILGGK
jgi:crotonobetainyl-CoA:carnitine CoA-transferase CaiB-like acyl-CoA transferase